MIFASDNWAGVAEPVAAALMAASSGVASSYGADELTRDVERLFCEVFERDVAVFFVATGTAANALALSAVARPAGIGFCHVDAHVNTDEGGATETLARLKLVGLEGAAGKIAPEALSAAIRRFPPNPFRYGQPSAISLSQLTEFGTAYEIEEVGVLTAMAYEADLAVHMDGARFGNAIAGLGVSPAEATWKAGVDILSFGGTKGGCWQAEAVVFFDPDKAADFQYLRKRAGHLISKTRFIAAQFGAYLRGGLWLDLAGDANRIAGLLASAIVDAGGRLAWPANGNEVFAILPRASLMRAKDAGAEFHEWPADELSGAERPSEDESLARLVCSFASNEDEVWRFMRALDLS